MKEKIPLSVAIIAKNEALNLPACLESVGFAEQIVVVDSGSTDETAEIARNFGLPGIRRAMARFQRSETVCD